jgi:3-oxoacyl-[acyl-carrier protein] reductase
MKKKTVLITGSSRGIGRETAKVFAKNGYNVVINYNKSEKEAKSLYDELNLEGYSVRMYKADVSNVNEVNQLINYTIGQFEAIDVLVNNAGISRVNLFTDITNEEWDEVMSVNLNGVFFATRKALQYMKDQGSGKIINIASIWGLVGGASEVHYSASKGAIIALTKALAKEVGPSNIQVNCVAPGVIKTDMLEGLSKETFDSLIEDTPLMRLGEPKDIAECVFYLASDKANFITGQVISPNGGFVI